LIRWRIWHLRMPAQRQIRVYRRKRILLRFILNCGLFKKKRKSQRNSKGAAKPRPLCTPLGLFLECLTVAGGRVLTCACMLRLFRVERCADGAPWALWMCDVVGRGWRVCERRAWFAGMIVVCVYVCVVCVAFRGL